jgi:hypothetical protein
MSSKGTSMAPESTKTTLQIPHERAGRAVVSQKLGGRLISAVALGGGWNGAGVYRVRAALGGERGQEQEVIVKVWPVHGSPVADEHAPTRSYARSRNLRPVHTLLRAHGLPTYELLACEFPSAEVPYFWVAMSALEGRPLDEWLGRTTGRDLAALHHLAGEALGRVHAITRPYDGWVDQPIPSRVDWGAAFFRGLETSLDGALERARAYEERRGRPVRPGDGSLAGGDALLRAFVAAHRLRWVQTAWSTAT